MIQSIPNRSKADDDECTHQLFDANASVLLIHVNVELICAGKSGLEEASNQGGKFYPSSVSEVSTFPTELAADTMLRMISLHRSVKTDPFVGFATIDALDRPSGPSSEVSKDNA
jgi:hypothetical protein